jgi:hypothetical protein
MEDTKVSRFRRFDPTTIRDCSSVLFVGGKRTGKSTLMREFMYHIKDAVYDGHVFSGSYDEDNPWDTLLPKKMVHYCLEDFQEGELKEALSIQNSRKELAKKYGSRCPSSLLVFEDLEFLKPSIWNSQFMRALIFNGRWVKEYCFVAYQYVMEVKMEMRGSFDYAVFTIDNSRAVRDRIWKQFAGIFPDFEGFEAVFLALTSNYKAMVIDLRARSYNIQDCVFWYKANPRLPPFKMGHRDIWNVRYVDKPMSSLDRDIAKKNLPKIVLEGSKNSVVRTSHGSSAIHRKKQ